MKTVRSFRRAFARERCKADVYVVLGLKWGDEGKGKVIAYLAKKADLAIRATGGANAGHTIFINGEKIALHLIPSGISSAQTVCLIGKGTVIDFDILFEEFEKVGKLIGEKALFDRIKISGTACVLASYHKDLDALYEVMKGKRAVGTTKKGIGPCYADKINRTALKVYDLLLPVETLEEKIAMAVKPHNILFQEFGMPECVVDPHEMALKFKEIGDKIKNMVVDGKHLVDSYLYNPLSTIVVEGAQATRLSIEEGDYPNCTSSDCNINGTLAGAHLSIDDVTEVVGADKAYSSRVGNGPFTTEYEAHLDEKGVKTDYAPGEEYKGDRLRDFAGEYGATTGRPRRVGAFDAIITKSSCQLGSVDSLCITRIDTLGEWGLQEGEVEMCYGYKYQGKDIDYYPDNIEYTGEVPVPKYIKFSGGWKITPDMKTYDSLPTMAKRYIEKIEEITGVPVNYIGTGPRNEDIIIRESSNNSTSDECGAWSMPD